jgi:hypothetical protein
VTGELATARPGLGPRVAAGGRAAVALVARHWGLAVLLLLAAGLRVAALVAIYPGIWFSDGNSYVLTAATGTLSTIRVSGYSLVVAPFWHAGSAAALIELQHLLGLGIVVVLYALLLRRGVPRWLALLAVVPAALDAYLIVVEHAIMAEAVFHASLVAALAALLYRDRLDPPAAAVGGLLLGYAGVVRSLAVPFAVLFVLYLLVRRVGRRPLLAFCLAWAVAPAAYATVYKVQHGHFAFNESSGRFLYGKVAPFADCAKLGGLPADERALCPDPSDRLTTNAYLWGAASPIHGLPPSADATIRDFALRVIRKQPLSYAREVGKGFVHYFEPGHRIGGNDYTVAVWQFPADPRTWGYPGYRGPIRPGDPEQRRKHPVTEPNTYVGAMVARPSTDPGVSRALHDYQRVAYTWGPLLAACVLLVLVGLVLRRGDGRLRLDAALLAATALTALLVSQALSLFSYRYGLILPVLLPPAAALAGASLLQGSARLRAG